MLFNFKNHDLQVAAFFSLMRYEVKVLQHAAKIMCSLVGPIELGVSRKWGATRATPLHNTMKQLSTIGASTVCFCVRARSPACGFGAKVCKPQAAARSRASMSGTARAKKGAAQSDDCESLEVGLAACRRVACVRSAAAQVPCTFD